MRRLIKDYTTHWDGQELPKGSMWGYKIELDLLPEPVFYISHWEHEPLSYESRETTERIKPNDWRLPGGCMQDIIVFLIKELNCCSVARDHFYNG